jgi:hypothetical protein
MLICVRLSANLKIELKFLMLLTKSNSVYDHYAVGSESRYALRLRYAHLVVSIEGTVEVCRCFTVFSC